MDEFGLIARYFAPLAGEGAEGLTDDAAELGGMLMTKDVLVEGVHFLKTDPLDLVARKALRVNRSDLIAKGARPETYALGLVWPQDTQESDIAAFSTGLWAEQKECGLALLGGDTTRGAQTVVSVTMFGRPLGPRITRAGGEPGQGLYVTGNIGDGLLGLEAAKGSPSADDEEAMPYRLPSVPSGAEELVARFASASLDVSDGLVADARHMAEASKLRLVIDVDRVPFSAAGMEARRAGRLAELLGGGDDYQTLFLSGAEEKELQQEAHRLGLRLSHIGRAEEGEGVGLLMRGTPWKADIKGYNHFA
ncbi:thiamine-phosphate kinase [Parvularcula maris]|uniref:Thiamine-monophosphate kinase n=1 Tax=Parvularcula maris TaxID=2965077 RepID=A0A9X2RK42_9PROT|nr:thiamine-phosphate kinase [Parvularcula maris]